MPKRPLSAYNLFFKDRREAIMLAAAGIKETPCTNDTDANKTAAPKQSRRRSSRKTPAGIGFANLARTIATEWKALDKQTKVPYETRAAVDKGRYNKEMLVWREKEKKKKNKAKEASSSLPRVNNLGIDYVIGIPTIEALNKREEDRGSMITARASSISAMQQQPLNDHEIRSLFQSSFHSTVASSNLSDSMNLSFHHTPSRMTQQQTNTQEPLSTNLLSDKNRRQLPQLFTNTMIPERSRTGANHSNFVGAGAKQVRSFQSHPYEHSLVSNNFGFSIDNQLDRQNQQLLLQSNDSRADSIYSPNNDNTNIDGQQTNVFNYLHHQYLEPLPIKENSQQQQQQQQQQQLVGGSTFVDNRRSSWDGIIPMPLRQQTTSTMQRRITVSGDIIPSSNEIIKRQMMRRSSLSLSSAVGNWFERNTNIQDDYTARNSRGDDNDPIRYLTGDSSLDQKPAASDVSSKHQGDKADQGK